MVVSMLGGGGGDGYRYCGTGGGRGAAVDCHDGGDRGYDCGGGW